MVSPITVHIILQIDNILWICYKLASDKQYIDAMPYFNLHINQGNWSYLHVSQSQHARQILTWQLPQHVNPNTKDQRNCIMVSHTQTNIIMSTQFIYVNL